MLKTAKGKIIAGTVAFGLLSGIGVAFGSTDAGLQLKSWYDKQFGKSSDVITKQVSEYATGKVEGLAVEYNGVKEKTTEKSQDKGKFTTDVTNSGVDKRAEEHINAIKEQKLQIETYLEGQFKNLSDFAAGLINEAGAEALSYARTDLKDHAGKVAAEVKEQMEKDITENTESAVKDLQETIAWAKSDLEDQLNKNADLTVEKIKGLIDAKIEQLRKEVNTINDALIVQNEKLIVMTGKSLLIAGMKELDTIVAGIDN